MDNLSILFTSSEVVPFAKTGGLADVAGMLPRVLADMGHTVRVALPKYGSIPGAQLSAAETVATFDVPVGKKTYTANVMRLVSNNHNLEYLFIGNDFLFDRPELYRDVTTGKDYKDNDARFIFFSRAILEYLKQTGTAPDILHANDWQAALLPVYLKTAYAADTALASIRTVFTIHNMAYQGLFPAESFAKLGLPKDLFAPLGHFEFWDQLNFMKAAIHYTDVITTVSETYAAEIQTTDELGAGLNGVLKDRAKDIFGIINGVDYDEWSPSRDKFIPHKFSLVNMSGKKMTRIELQNRVGLPIREHVPLIGMISRLADQKGFDLIKKAADKLFALDIQMIILGTGEQKYHDFLEKLETRYPDKLKALITYDNEMAHWIEAGSDLFLMPSRYEPCGLNQLYSLKYGAIPIVRATGGLADTIKDADPEKGTGTGFVFKKYTPEAMLAAIKRALPYFDKKRKWRRIMKNGMTRDFSWTNSAEKYSELYGKLLRR